ncbi:MAG TPA: hypothetical protein VJ045_00640 [Hyphomicrobiaceae bacterium]|nr:hypothetical protein [Hyphomicrobiaceae bacterium]
MRIIRVVIAVVLTLGLVVSPVAAAMAQVQMAKCEQMTSMDHDDCLCCGEATGCPASSCVAQCFSSQAGLAGGASLPRPSHQELKDCPSVMHWSLTISPDLPPPRS